jgi:hypothetical protein
MNLISGQPGQQASDITASGLAQNNRFSPRDGACVVWFIPKGNKTRMKG